MKHERYMETYMQGYFDLRPVKDRTEYRIELFSQEGFYTEIFDIRYWINSIERKGNLSKPGSPKLQQDLPYAN